MRKFDLLFLVSLFAAVNLAIGGEMISQAEPSPTPDQNQNSTEIFKYETTYTANSDFYDDRGKFGDGGSIYNDFSYAHRFLITGNWYFRAGVEYERFDFTGSDNGLPDHLQTIHALAAFEYVVHDHAAAGIDLEPGPYFENNITGNSIDIPWKAWVSFPIKKDNIFGVIGAGGSLNSSPIIAPGGGMIWILSDHLRLEAVVPKPALVYSPNDDWDFRLVGNLYYESFRTDNVMTREAKLQVQNAVVQYSEDRAGLSATYSHFKPFDITFDAGVTVRRDFDFFRAEASAKTDPAPYVRLAVQSKF